MGKKGKAKVEQEPIESDEDFSQNENEDQVDIEQQVEKKIKELPTLKEKVQAIAINGHLKEKRKFDEQLQNKIEGIEQKFRTEFQPFINEINNIISGKHEFSDADFQQIGELLTEQEHETKHNYFNNEKIPEYWLKVLTNHEIMAENIEDRDEPILKHLEKIEAEKSQDFKTMKITFYFSENQWFTNDKLVKNFELDEDTIKRSSGDTIAWKEGKNITIKIVKKKKKKGAEKKTKQVKEKSFFNFFVEIEIDSDEDVEDEEDDQDVEDLELQYEMANALYEQIVPKSLEFYLGIAEVFDNFGECQDDAEKDCCRTQKCKM